jgi:PA14 domain
MSAAQAIRPGRGSGVALQGSQVNDMRCTSPLRPRVLLALVGALACASQIGCAAQTEEIIALPGYPEFTVAISPGVAPGLTDGCEGDQLPAGRVRGTVYYIPDDTRLLPNFNTLSPVDTLCLDRLDVTPRRSVYPAFPGLRDRYRWFAVNLQGSFSVDHPGDYDFRLTSDDGSQFYIDDHLVIDNDGYHPPRMAPGAAGIAAGRHTIRVAYWQGPGPLALVLEIARPGEPFRVFRFDQPL